MRISVVIPTCDRPKSFLSHAIDSVLNQSYSPHEVIVVDNGIKEVSEIFSDVLLYRLPPGQGVSRARNFGAAMSNGTHLAFLDDDDWWDSEFLNETRKVAESEKKRCVYGRLDKFQSGEIAKYKLISISVLNLETLLDRNPGTGGQNVLIERALFWEIGGFDEALPTSEDKALAIKVLLAKEPIGIAGDAVAILRSHDGTRIRNRILPRLRFVWKFRTLYGLRKFSKRVIYILFNYIKKQLDLNFR